MTDPNFWQSVALALVPLGGVVGGFVAQTLIAGRNVYINSITAERSKWLDKLRINLSAYYSLSASVAYRRRTFPSITDSEIRKKQISDRFVDLEKLEERASLLRLQLNPKGIIDGNVLSIIEHLQAHQDRDGDDLSKLRDLLLSHAQWLLKAEWEKVKWEAGGAVHRHLHKADEGAKLDQYEKWVKEDRNSRMFAHLFDEDARLAYEEAQASLPSEPLVDTSPEVFGSTLARLQGGIAKLRQRFHGDRP